jgi:hypothetical protein
MSGEDVLEETTSGLQTSGAAEQLSKTSQRRKKNPSTNYVTTGSHFAPNWHNPKS